jgi:hypothetical protein
VQKHRKGAVKRQARGYKKTGKELKKKIGKGYVGRQAKGREKKQWV